MNIHPTAIIDKKAEIERDVSIGPHTIIQGKVIIGQGTKIASNILLDDGTIIGKNCSIHHGAVLGTPPQDLKFSEEKTILKIGDNCIIREYVSINRGTKHRGQTTVGNNCFFMMYTHVAHDCIIGNNVIMANSVNLGGHVEIEDYAIVGGIVPVHQFVRIGTHSIIGGGFRAVQDVCPYALAAGYRLRIVGLNLIGLKRRGFPQETIHILGKAFRMLFHSKFNTTQAIEKIKSELEPIPEINHILDFIAKSERGIVK
ncbi:MAG TPA: acyl-ACP--UDP-N-acetylglucosamine O-acyltransferase [candidate division Zixibacteria bacterium]